MTEDSANSKIDQEIRLTQFSHGAGCGCKISPKQLEEILQTNTSFAGFDKLLVGNQSRDDAAVYDLGNGTALIATTDFFMPIVDDAFDFGRIAAANAISDVYAMGGTPLMAIAILGWPVEKLPLSLAGKVIDGGRSVCQEAGIPLAGGHSIDSTEPIFGLAVNGMVPIRNLKKNNTAAKGNLVFLTKPLGTGILSTAQKRGLLKPGHNQLMIDQMATINKAGQELGKLDAVTAMTDVTGFGLLGHLVEMADGSGCGVELFYDSIPVLEPTREYLAQRIFPDATTRNWSSYSDKVKFEKGINVLEAFSLLPDPQTNGGLLFTVDEQSAGKVERSLSAIGVHADLIGKMVEQGEKTIRVRPGLFN
jgi:selenide, water dikinase